MSRLEVNFSTRPNAEFAAALATRGTRVAWVEAPEYESWGALFVADVDNVASARRVAIVPNHVHASAWATRLVVADTGAVRDLDVDPMPGRMAFLGTDHLLVDPYGSGVCVLAPGSKSLVKHTSVHATIEGDGTVTDAVVATASSDTHVWALTSSGEILRVAFESPVAEGFGSIPSREHPIEQLGIAAGEVLVLVGERDWIAYDIETGAQLWHRPAQEDEKLPFLYFGYRQFGTIVDSSLVQLIDPRTGQPLETVEREKAGRPGWRGNLETALYVLFDASGRSRVLLNSVRTFDSWHQDPKGRSAIFQDRKGVLRYCRLVHEQDETQSANPA